jgi:hypothetical protein
MQTIKLLNGNAVKLALKYYGDATGFVQILEANDLEDFVINAPISAQTIANNKAGDTILVLPPTMGITVGMLVYCPGYNTYGLVAAVKPVFQVPSGIPFAQGYADIQASFPPNSGVAETLPPGGRPVRIMPGLGKQVSTNVTIVPPLDNEMFETTIVIFAVGAPTELVIPNLPAKNRGTP